MTQWVKNLNSIHGDSGSVPGLAQWVKELGVVTSHEAGPQKRLGSGVAVAVA